MKGIYFLDKTLYPCVDGSDVLLYLRIVRIFHAAQMEKA